MTRKEKDSWMRNNDSHKQKKKEVHYTVNSLTYLDIKKTPVLSRRKQIKLNFSALTPILTIDL